ncbi:hypothetical protein K488DRAFT_40891 [Vararia minispora EC-137]|uniref:Uncharacterized protein n=1 Tax=Vararia minispora EC-137 TaxID=1314806 RepID=A0ACB8QZ95_9AGAM|nr:hypothetical protein K488DRAFT_40891 [Vararia minispora EC-137]
MSIHTSTFVRPHLNLGYLPAQADGVSSLPELVDFVACNNPQRTFGLQLRAGEDTVPWTISFSELQGAVQEASAWLVSSCGAVARVSRDVKVAPVALLLASDIGIFIYMVALMRIGVPVVLLSARLTPVAIAHLIKATAPSVVLMNSQVARSVKETKALLDIDGICTQFTPALSYEDILNAAKERVQPISLLPRYADFQLNDRDAIILHSSGTTGLPKPIYHSHAYLLVYAAGHRFSKDVEPFKFNMSTLPLYHGFGLLAPCLSLSIGLPFVLPPASIIPTARTTLKHIEITGAGSMLSVPSILEDIARMGPSAIEALASLDFIAIGGAAMKEAVAKDFVEQGVKLLNHWGATELGCIAPIERPPAGYDFHYLIPRTDIGLQFRPVDVSRRLFQLVGRAIGWTEDFVVQDLLEQHPSDPTQYRILGRVDDLLVLGTGEKVRPAGMEAAFSEHPKVRAAIAFGEGQFSVGVIVELLGSSREQDAQEVLASLDPYLEHGNSLMDKHAKVSRDLLVITYSDEKPLPRTDKGSIARKAAYGVFEGEIKLAYSRADDAFSAPFPTYDDTDLLHHAVRNIVVTALHIGDPQDLQDSDDFFEAGMDSLQASRIRRAVLASLRTTRDVPRSIVDISPEFVFENPSVDKLHAAVVQIMQGKSLAPRDREENRIKAMLRMVEEYTTHLPRAASRPKDQDRHVVLITGASGSLGCMLVARFATDLRVGKVLCLNRGGLEAAQRQRDSMQRRGAVISDEAWGKVIVFGCDASKPFFGLSAQQFEQLLEATHIFHNAWPVNFNRTLASFETSIKALCNLVHLALLCAAHVPSDHRPRRILFASSIAVAGRFPLLHPDGPVAVPEIHLDPAVTSEFGYPEGKWVCERILQAAADMYGGRPGPLLAAASVRIGQLTGPEDTGVWNETEHVPIIVRTAQKINAMPILSGSLSWLPANRAAAVIADILFDKDLKVVYHVENPSRQTWAGVLDDFALLLGDLPRVPYPEWLARAKALGDDPAYNASAKIIDFLENDFVRLASGTVILDTTAARLASPTMARSCALDRGHLAEYIAYWKSVGVLDD